MVATPLNPAERFSALEDYHVLFLPVVAASTKIPTRAEINAGTDLSTEIEGWEGFDIESGEITMPGLTRFDGTLPGKQTVNKGVLRIYADRGGDDVADVLPDGTSGYIVIMPTGDHTGDRMNIWPVRVNRLTEVHSMEAASMYRITFSHPSLPKERATIPAATP